MTQDIFGREKYLMGPNFRIHSVRFSKIRAYLKYPLVFNDVHVRSGVVYLLASRKLSKNCMGVFENVRVINDHYIFEEHPNVTLIYQNVARMKYTSSHSRVFNLKAEKQAGF